LRGEGFERTPEFDITDRQRPIPPRTQLIDSIAALGQAGSGGNLPPTDAGSDAADASSSNPPPGNTDTDATPGDSGAP